MSEITNKKRSRSKTSVAMVDIAAADSAGVIAIRNNIAANGFEFIPVLTGDKKTVQPKWTSGGFDPNKFSSDNANTGILMRGLVGLDVDVDNPQIAALVEAAIREMLHGKNYFVRYRDNYPRKTFYLAAENDKARKEFVRGTIPNDKPDTFAGVEALGYGNYSHVYGLHPSGETLKYEGPNFTTHSREWLSILSEDQVIEILNVCAPLIKAEPVTHKKVRDKAPQFIPDDDDNLWPHLPVRQKPDGWVSEFSRAVAQRELSHVRALVLYLITKNLRPNEATPPLRNHDNGRYKFKLACANFAVEHPYLRDAVVAFYEKVMTMLGADLDDQSVCIERELSAIFHAWDSYTKRRKAGDLIGFNAIQIMYDDALVRGEILTDLDVSAADDAVAFDELPDNYIDLVRSVIEQSGHADDDVEDNGAVRLKDTYFTDGPNTASEYINSTTRDESAGGTQAPAKKFGQSFTEFFAAYEPLRYLLWGIIVRSNLYSLTAPTTHGKTTWLCAVVCAVITGRNDILNIEAEQSRVLYIVYENPDNFRLQLAATARFFGVDPKIVDDYFVVVSGSTFKQDYADTKNSGEEFGLVIIDTFQAAFDGTDFNANAEVLNFFRRCRAFTDLPGRPAVIVATHPVKNAPEDNLLPFGGGSIVNEVDGNLTLWRTPNTDISTLRATKLRGQVFEPKPFEIKTKGDTGFKDIRGGAVLAPYMKPATVTAAAAAMAQKMQDGDRKRLLTLQAIAADPSGSLASWLDTIIRQTVTPPSKATLGREVESLSTETPPLIVRQGEGRKKITVLTAEGAKWKEKKEAELAAAVDAELDDLIRPTEAPE
jgi:hypothetical protein